MCTLLLFGDHETTTNLLSGAGRVCYPWGNKSAPVLVRSDETADHADRW